MSNSELLACPFCGDLNARTMVDTRSPIPYLERCSTCGAQGPKAENGDEAIAAWNRRTQPDELRAERRMLLDLLAIIHRDGGQYVDTHGLEKAWQDAITLTAELRAENERLKSLIGTCPLQTCTRRRGSAE